MPPDDSPAHDPERYGRSFADVYDEWYQEMPTEPLVSFLGRRVAAGAEVLELGVGTGRVALALSAAGFAVTGLDSSADMLAQLATKPGADAVATITGDAADPSVYPRAAFDAVVAVYNLIFNLTSPGAQERCLAGVASTLRAGGLLVLEAFVPAGITERRRDLVTRSVEPGRVVLIATDTDPTTQVVTGNHIEITDAGTRLRPWTIRVSTPQELDAMAAAAGMELVERLEDWTGTPFVAGESAHHVSVYRVVGGGAGGRD
ncbi:MAG: class I SAM-dependent methyltransferase [Acidimicrobiales bacterium]